MSDENLSLNFLSIPLLATTYQDWRTTHFLFIVIDKMRESGYQFSMQELTILIPQHRAPQYIKLYLDCYIVQL